MTWCAITYILLLKSLISLLITVPVRYQLAVIWKVATEVPESSKIHITTKHIEQCLQFLSDGSGSWSEHAGEVHRNFLKFWSRYEVNLVLDSQYKNNLRKSVIELSA